jgi:hypothetical protein
MDVFKTLILDTPTVEGATGTVTSVDLTAGTGISVSGGPITSSGSITVTNTSPDQTVSIASGTGISVTGTYPSFTVTNSSPSSGGDVVGPASATDNAIARYDSTTGKLIQNSAVTVDDAGGINVGATGYLVVPSYIYHDTDTNTYIGFPTTDAFAVTTNGTEKFRVNYDGDVGIGTGSPSAKLDVVGAAEINGNLTVADNSTLGSSNSDTVNFNARVSSEFTPATDNTYDLGRTGHEWRDLYIDGTANIDSLVADTADVNGGTIDGATIGGTTPAAGTFTQVNSTGAIIATGSGTFGDDTDVTGDFTVTGNLSATGTAHQLEIGTGTFTISRAGVASTVFSYGNGRTNIISSTSGIMVGADSLTDATTKSFKFGAPHYSTNSEEPTGIFFNNTSSANVIAIGGGTGSFNAPTEVAIYAASNNTTTTGTKIVSVTTTGVAVTGAVSANANSDAIYTGATLNNASTGTSARMRMQLTAGSATSYITQFGSGHATNASQFQFNTAGLTTFLQNGSEWARGSFSTGLQLSDSSGRAIITTNTSDGSDNTDIVVCGGGGASAGRGGYFRGFGNEHATLPGYIYLYAGAVANSRVSVYTGLSSVETARFTDTGVAVTGALSSTTGANFATSSGNVGIGTSSPLQKLDVSGNLALSGSGTSARSIEIGEGRTGNGYSYVDLIGDTTYTDFGARFVRGNSGANASTMISHRGTGDLSMWAADAGALQFGTSGTERARINSSGNMGIGTTPSTGARLEVLGASAGAFYGTQTYGPVYYAKENNTDNVGRSIFNFIRGSTVVGQIVTTNTTCAYNNVSDYRLKEITGPVVDSGKFIDALKPKVGTWKSDGSKFVGFLAHEFAEVSPVSVTGEKDAVNAEGEPIYQSMQASTPEVMANIIAELQSLRARVAALEPSNS